MRKFETVALVWGLVFAAACGGESDSGTEGGGGGDNAPDGEVDTGLPEATPLEDVTPQQYANACEALRDDVEQRMGPDRAVRGVCEAYGAALTDEPAACRAQADSCVPEVNAGTFTLPITRDQLDFTQFECGDTGELEGCSVTIGEFETCVEDQIAGIEALINDNDCDNAATVSLQDALALMNIAGMTPASCTRFQQECPGVGPFGDTASP